MIALALALAAARTLGWCSAWLYAGTVLLIKVSSAATILPVNPAVLNARGTRQKPSQRERIFFAVFVPTSLAVPIVAGLDVGGAGWTHRSVPELAIGVALALLGAALVIWALRENAFFEPTVRLQTDRGQGVCDTGPYRLVRHPGYLGAMVGAIGPPPILGSRWALVPVAVQAVAFVVRTAYEDRMLRDELEGYEEFAERTRYRLLPPIW